MSRIDLKELRQLAEQPTRGVYLPTETMRDILDKIDRYERALENIQFVCTKGTATIFPRDTIETCEARAREALNPKGGVK